MYERPVLDLPDALRLLDAAMAAAPDETASPVAVAIVDDNGDTVAFGRMDGTPPLNRHYALQKAYTASRMKQDISAFAAGRTKTGRQVSDFADPRLVGSGHGGVVIRSGAEGAVVGAIGVSGATPEQDERIVRAATARVDL